MTKLFFQDLWEFVQDCWVLIAFLLAVSCFLFAAVLESSAQLEKAEQACRDLNRVPISTSTNFLCLEKAPQ